MSLISYVKETRGEMKHVSWPTRRQAINLTALVIGLSLFVALVLGFSDLLFTFSLEEIFR